MAIFLLSSEISCLRIKVAGNMSVEYKRGKDTKFLLCSYFFFSFREFELFVSKTQALIFIFS